MKGNIRRGGQTEPFISKPVEDDEKHKASKDQLATEATSTLPRDWKTINPPSAPKLGDAEIVDTKSSMDTLDSTTPKTSPLIRYQMRRKMAK